jgi:hypothetical protein
MFVVPASSPTPRRSPGRALKFVLRSKIAKFVAAGDVRFPQRSEFCLSAMVGVTEFRQGILS